jgi:hypothetical protein
MLTMCDVLERQITSYQSRTPSISTMMTTKTGNYMVFFTAAAIWAFIK